MPLKMVRHFDPYHEIEEPMERRMAVVRLHSEGWAPKSIAQGTSGCINPPSTGSSKGGSRKASRVWKTRAPRAALWRAQGRPQGDRGHQAPATESPPRCVPRARCASPNGHTPEPRHLRGRILALNRRLYGLDKPRGPSQEKREMPFASSRRHEYWTTDVRYVEHRLGGNIYVISVLENHSRAILASGIFRSQDLPPYLSVLYSAVERYGSPEAIVTDGGAIFRANQALSIYEALNIDKEEIARGRP